MEAVLGSAGLALAAMSVLYAARQVRLFVADQHHQFAWQRKEYALGYSIVRNERLRDARIAIDHAFGTVTASSVPPTVDAINAKIANHAEYPGLYTHVINLLGHWENLALAIDQGVANEFVAFEMVAGTVRSYVDFFENFIRDRQRINPRAYWYLLQLNERWKMCLADYNSLDRMKQSAERARPAGFAQKPRMTRPQENLGRARHSQD